MPYPGKYSDLITQSLIEIGAVDMYQAPKAEYNSIGEDRLNMMLDGWAAERLQMYHLERSGPFDVTGGTQDYEIGDGATWDTPRPIWIERAGYILTSTDPENEVPLRIWTNDEWARQTVKTVQSSLPTALWYERTFPYGTIHLWPVPSEDNQIVIYHPIPLTTPVASTDDVSLPPAYYECVMYHLALRLAGPFRLEPMESTVSFAALAMEKVKNANLQLDALRVDMALRGRTSGMYNWWSDTWVGYND